MATLGEDCSWSFQAASPARRRVLSLAHEVAKTDCSVLIVGPTGVGKDLLAEEIYRHGSRARQRFVALNCAALGSALFESEMFGHARGAFTSAHTKKAGLVEIADNGTLFLDEIGELGLDAQAKLLRFLSTGKFWPIGELHEKVSNVRLIAATNRNLSAMLGTAFREDLFYRISVATLVVPPLEASDVRMLAEHFTCELALRFGTSLSVPERAELSSFVSQRRFSGGARQLRNTLERFFLVHRPNRPILASLEEAAELGTLDAKSIGVATALPTMEGGLHAATAMQRLDDLVFLDAARYSHSVRELAQRLGRTPQAVYQRLNRLQLAPGDLGDMNKLSDVVRKARQDAASVLPWLQATLTSIVDH